MYVGCLLYPLYPLLMSLNALPFSHLNDNEFAAMIYEFRNQPVRFVPERLSNLSINPLTCDFVIFMKMR